MTSGTGPGTKELTGIKGAAASFNPTNLTAFGGKVLFNGKDKNGKLELWETDGTVGGTLELTSALSGGGLGFNPVGLEVFNNEVLFSGKDASGHSQLWETNGTTAGTKQLSVSGASTSGLATLDLTAATLPTIGVLFQDTRAGRPRSGT